VKLSDVMSAFNLAVYAEVGLVLFLFAFALVAVDLLRRGPKLEQLALLPLEGGDADPSAREEHS